MVQTVVWDPRCGVDGPVRNNDRMMARRPRRPDIEAAAFRVGSGVRRTPVLTLLPDDTGLRGNVVLKLELFQHTGSFKSRGALNSVLSLTSGVEGVCAASGGNHAAAVAWAAERAGITADVFVPTTATPAKLARIEQYGGKVHLVEGHVREALAAATVFSEARDVPLIHPYDTFDTVSGQGTLGLEVEEQVPDADLVVVGCGGGGLYAGLATALEGIVSVQPVEPTECPDLARALEAGHPVETEVGGVAADSLGAPHIGDIAFAVAQDQQVRPVLVGEDDIVAARRFLWDRVRVLAEPGACVALASLLTGAVSVSARQTVVVIVSGGNNESVPQ
jgi:threonine dehydratase